LRTGSTWPTRFYFEIISNASGGVNTINTYSSTAEVLDDCWHFIALRHIGGGTVNYYVDGQYQDGRDSVDMTDVDIHNLFIGAWGYGSSVGNYLNGQIDNVMIFDRALSEHEIAELYEVGRAQHAAAGEWRFDEGYGTTAYDDSAQSNDGTINGGAAYTTSGKFGRALDFAGDDDYVDVGDISTDIKSVSLWVKPDSVTATTEYPLDLNGTGYVKITNGTVTGEGFDSPTIYINGILGASTVDTNWNHIVITTATGIDANDLDIGRKDTDYFSGFIDEVKVYPFVLSESDVKLEYNRGKSVRLGSDYQLPSGLVGYWPMDEGSGSTVHDVSGNGNDGTITDATWRGAADSWLG